MTSSGSEVFSDLTLAAIDIAAVHSAAVSLTSSGQVTAERAFRREGKGFLAVRQVAYDMLDFCTSTANGDLLVVALEDTRFGSAAFANVGELRGCLYEILLRSPLVMAVVLVSPSRWRSYHQAATKVKGEAAKRRLYAEVAERRGYVPDLPTAKNREDAVSAFLMGLLALEAAKIRIGAGHGIQPRFAHEMALRIATDDSLWIRG